MKWGNVLADLCINSIPIIFLNIIPKIKFIYYNLYFIKI